MTSPSAARAAGEAYLESTKPLGPEPMGMFIIEARRVVTALLEALRESTNGIAWLIERGQPEGREDIEWWSGQSLDSWTTNPRVAVRFAREQDAEQVITQGMDWGLGGDLRPARSVEHLWMKVSPAPSTPSAASMTRDGTPGPWLIVETITRPTRWYLEKSHDAGAGGFAFDTEAEALAVRDVLNGEARPALTVERLAEIFRAMMPFACWDSIKVEDGSYDQDDMAEFSALALAEELLPRLAGPAQEGPQ